MFADALWYKKHPLILFLIPFSWVYRFIVFIRRWYLQRFCQWVCPVPLIVVGNITLGGVGKTPLVIELAKKIQQKGLKVGIVSRGYGSRVAESPYEVQLHDLATKVGDEPLMMAQSCCCPVVIARRRTEAVNYLLEHHQVQIIISDDGLQHYRMGRTIEIVVIDGTRGLGNGYCLPAGPLRETDSRLQEVDYIVINEGGMCLDNSYSMNLTPTQFIHLSTGEAINPNSLRGTIAAVAGIGNPQRFYSTLTRLGLEFSSYSYPDHYQFKLKDLTHSESVIIMTEKDAVKCSSFNLDKLYYLQVRATVNDAFWDALWSHQQLQGSF